MSSKAVQPKAADSSDIIKYVIAIALVAGGLFAFYWFENQLSPVLRGGIMIAAIVAAAAMFFISSKGKQTIEFLGEVRFELRKVVWPTRDEAVRTTGVVMLMVVIIALMLAGFDVVIQWAVKWFLSR